MSKDYSSSTKWEKSDFGGYRALIWDHPEIKVGWDVDFKIPEKGDLGQWTSEKLLKIFLCKANELGFVEHLTRNPLVGETTGPYGFGKREVACVNKKNQGEVLASIMSMDAEYRALFEHYKEVIIKADIEVRIPEEKNEGKGEGKGEGEEEINGGMSASPKDERAKGSKILKRILGEIKKREWKPYESLTSRDFSKSLKWIYPKNHSRLVINENHERLSKSLVNLLDISFDPQKDRINSLRTGKIDARKVAEVIPGNLNIYYKIEEHQSTKPFSVVILQDESGSMESKMHYSKELITILYLAFSEILPPNKLSIYGHSGYSEPEIYVYKDPYHDDFVTAIGAMSSKQENYDGPVIESIYNKVREQTDDNIIFIVLSDGQPLGKNYGSMKDITDLKRVVEKCRRDGFVTIGIGIQHDTQRLYDYNCKINDLSHDMVKKTSYLINRCVKTEFQ